jgi:hypothetical protein
MSAFQGTAGEARDSASSSARDPSLGAWIRLRRRLRLSFRNYDDVRRLRGGSMICFSQEARRDIPVPSISSNDGHRFAIVAGQRALDRTPMPIFERHTIADRKFKHGLMRVDLMKTRSRSMIL